MSVPSDGYLDVAGLRYYYQFYKSFEKSHKTIVMLHGGLGHIETLSNLIGHFSPRYNVVGIDLRGHGRTPVGPTPFSFAGMASDVVYIIDHLGLEKVDVLGYSLGGVISLRLALQMPDIVDHLVMIGAGFSRDGFYPEALRAQRSLNARMAKVIMNSSLYRSYESVCPTPEAFPKFLDRLGELMRTPYDWSEEIPAIRSPTLLIYGDRDMYDLDHVTRFFRLLGGGLGDPRLNNEFKCQHSLAIIPNATHYDVIESETLPTIIDGFLNAAD